MLLYVAQFFCGLYTDNAEHVCAEVAFKDLQSSEQVFFYISDM
jgi:hypothetical protein